MSKKPRKPRRPRPPRAERVDAQAYRLIAERIREFGDRWREGCAIRIPKGFRESDIATKPDNR